MRRIRMSVFTKVVGIERLIFWLDPQSLKNGINDIRQSAVMHLQHKLVVGMRSVQRSIAEVHLRQEVIACMVPQMGQKATCVEMVDNTSEAHRKLTKKLRRHSGVEERVTLTTTFLKSCTAPVH